MFGTKYLNDEHDCNVVSTNSLNTHDANDMQSQKLGEAMFDEDDIFCPPSFYEQIYYDESMPPIYDDYIDESGFGEVMTLFSDESNISEEVPIDYENKVAIYDDYCDDLYAIKSRDDYIYKTCDDYDYPFLNITPLMWKQFLVFESFMILPLFRMRRILLMWRVVNFLCL